MKSKTKFKQTEIGMIPNEWGIKLLGDEIELCYGKGLTESKRVVGKFPVFGSNGIVGFHNQFLVQGPGIIIGRKGSVGEIKFSKDNFWPIDTTYFIKLKKRGNIHFWYYFLLTLNLNKMNSHSAVPGLNREQVYELSKEIPEYEEQSTIAKILSDLDAKIELNQQMNKTLEAIGQAIFKRWFIDFEFPNEEGKPYKSSGGEMVYNEEIGKDIPEGWKVLRMKDIVSNKKFSIVDGPFGTQLHSEEYVETGIPVIRIINLSFEGSFIRDSLVYITEKKFDKLIRSSVYPGDILLAKTGATIGKLARLPKFIHKGLVASSIMKISPNNERFNEYYLFNVIKKLSEQKYWESISGGSTRSTINIPDIKELKLLYPIDEVMKKYHEVVDYLYKKIEYNEESIFNLSQIRDSLLPRLMSGKIRVPVAIKA